MTSERTAAIPVQSNLPASIHEVVPGNHSSNSARSSFRQSGGGNPFATSSDGQNLQSSVPQNTEIVSLTQPPPDRRGPAEGGDAVNAWAQDVPQNRSSNSNLRETNDQPLPPSPLPGVRLVDAQFAALPARPARTRTMSTDPNNRLPAAAASGGLSRNASRMRLMPSDTGEVFYNEKHVPVMKGSIKDRLSATIESAQTERDKYAARARATGLALNIAIGLQVLLGSLTTGLSAVATRGHNQSAVATTILGALATLVASYLARARGSNEPELSITRVKDLEHFLRDCHNFSDDHANYVGHEYDDQIENLRRRFEELLGNANGERKLSPPGS